LNFDTAGGTDDVYADLISVGTCNMMYKNHVQTKINALTAAAPALGIAGVYQIAASCTVYLRHLSSLFDSMPLVKGAYLTIVMQLNNSTVVVDKSAASAMTILSSSNSVGGLCPLLIASTAATNGGACLNVVGAAHTVYTASVAVGSKIIEPAQLSVLGAVSSSMGTSITLNVPSYQMSSVYEQSYISDPIRAIPFTDFYQYTVSNIPIAGQINQRLTNGIAGLTRFTAFPVFSSAAAVNTDLIVGMPCIASPWDPACTSGGGSPLCYINNFQLQVAGANVLAQSERYNYEQYLTEFSAMGRVNGGLTDGVTSGLISEAAWGFAPVYTVDLSRMNAAERTVPKSVVFQGTNMCATAACDYYCFLEFESTGLRVDILSGARV